MQYELTTSKSSSAIARPNGAIHLIECFRRFAGKSKSKKRLFGFGFGNKQPEFADTPINIDQKQKGRRFGSTPNVHAVHARRTEFLHFSPCDDDVPNGGMNQSCYGGIPSSAQTGNFIVANYDNMDPVVNQIEDSARRRLVNGRSRKTMSEVGCPITVVEVGNLQTAGHENLPKNGRDLNEINGSVQWRNSSVVQNRLVREQRRSQFFDSSSKQTDRRRFSNFGNTGANTSAIHSPLPATSVRPAAEFGAFARSDGGSSSTESNGMSNDRQRHLNSTISKISFNHDTDFNVNSRSSSLAGQVHQEDPDLRHERSERISRANLSGFIQTPDRQFSFENGTFHGHELHDHLDNMRQMNESLSRENRAINKRLREQQQIISELKAQLKKERKLFGEEKQSLLEEHQAELKRKDAELVEKEINVIQRLSLGTIENSKYICSSTPDGNKFQLGESTSMNFNRLNGSARPQSLYINSPNNRLSSQDLVSKERHRNVFTPNQVHPASHSTTPDSGAVIPLSSSPHLIPLFRDLVTYAFHVHNSADSAEYFVNNWLKNIRPQICSPYLRIAFADILSKLDQMQNEDIEQILEQTNKLLSDSVDTLFGLKRDLVELHKREALAEMNKLNKKDHRPAPTEQ